MDYTDPRLYKSGLLKDAIESHFWLLENSGRSLDSIFIEMQISIDAMMENLVKDEQKLNEVTEYLFDLLERHSLLQASEYLALKVLNEVSCTIESDHAKQLETYRAMKRVILLPTLYLKETIMHRVMDRPISQKNFQTLKVAIRLLFLARAGVPNVWKNFLKSLKIMTSGKNKGWR